MYKKKRKPNIMFENSSSFKNELLLCHNRHIPITIWWNVPFKEIFGLKLIIQDFLSQNQSGASNLQSNSII